MEKSDIYNLSGNSQNTFHHFFNIIIWVHYCCLKFLALHLTIKLKKENLTFEIFLFKLMNGLDSQVIYEYQIIKHIHLWAEYNKHDF